MSEKINDGDVIAVSGKQKWRSKFVCRECRGTQWKTSVKGKEYKCRGCGKVNTGVLFVWSPDKKGLIMWVPPPPKPVEQVPVERVEPKDGVEPVAGTQPPTDPQPAEPAVVGTGSTQIDTVQVAMAEVKP